LKISGLPLKLDAKSKERDQEIQLVTDEIESAKKLKLEELNAEFDLKKKQLLSQHIQEATTAPENKRLTSFSDGDDMQ
jgi:hypothetical protein